MRRIIFCLAVGLVAAARIAAPAGPDDDLVFIHHSVGQNWLDQGLHDALTAKAYVDERNDITYGTVVSPDAGRPASLGDVPGDSTDMCHWLLWFNDYLDAVATHGCADGFNHIVMFKSCYPTSDVWDDGTEPGDPFSSEQSIANYKAVYRHPSGPGHSYTHAGASYKPLEDVFAGNPDILFIPVTATPSPLPGSSTGNARRARQFNNWLTNEWLPSYAAAHPSLRNVAVFDWFNVLAYPDKNPRQPDRLRALFGGQGDGHPNAFANVVSTWVFAGRDGNFLDAAWKSFSSADE